MEDSRVTDEEVMSYQLDNFRKIFAGAKEVVCATSSEKEPIVFDFSNVKEEDINFGINGSEYIKAKAPRLTSGEIDVCFIKYVNHYATRQNHELRPVEKFNHMINKFNITSNNKDFDVKELQEKLNKTIEIQKMALCALSGGKYFPEKLEEINKINHK